MNKASINEPNKILISNRKPFKIIFNSLKPFPFIMNKNSSFLTEKLKRMTFVSNSMGETCPPKIEEKKEIKDNCLGKKVKFRVYEEKKKELELKGNKKFITTRFQKKCERWNKIERFKFLEGLYKFGCNWKAIKKYIKSRSSLQVRSHGQKFLLKLRKFRDDSLGIDFTKDSNEKQGEMIKKLKEIIENSKNKNIIYILSQKLSGKGEEKKNTKNEIDNAHYNITNYSNKICIEDNYFNSNVEYAHNDNSNVRETKENSLNLKDNIDEISRELNEYYQENIFLKEYGINHNDLGSAIQNKIDHIDSCLNQKYLENNKDNCLNNIFLGKKIEDYRIINILDDLGEIKKYWNFNNGVCILNNENSEYYDKTSETDSSNLFKNFYNYGIKN